MRSRRARSAPLPELSSLLVRLAGLERRLLDAADRPRLARLRHDALRVAPRCGRLLREHADPRPRARRRRDRGPGESPHDHAREPSGDRPRGALPRTLDRDRPPRRVARDRDRDGGGDGERTLGARDAGRRSEPGRARRVAERYLAQLGAVQPGADAGPGRRGHALRADRPRRLLRRQQRRPLLPDGRPRADQSPRAVTR